MDIKSVDLIELAEAYGAELRYKGSGEYGGNCPICGNPLEKADGDYSDRFTVKQDLARWYCRTAYQDGTHQHFGDAADLVQLVEGVNYPAAVKILENKRFHSQPLTAAHTVAKAKPLNMFDAGYWTNANNKFQDQLSRTS